MLSFLLVGWLVGWLVYSLTWFVTPHTRELSGVEKNVRCQT